MANWNLPALTDTYANYLQYLKDRDADAAKGFDPAKVTLTNPLTDTIRWSSASNKWEKYNGSSWADLAATYAIAISGLAGSATKLATARTLSVSIVTSAPTNPTFDGQADKSLEAQLTGTLVNAALGYTAAANNQTMYVGTTAMAINRSSSAITLTGVNIDGNAVTVTNGVYTNTDQNIGGTKTIVGALNTAVNVRLSLATGLNMFHDSANAYFDMVTGSLAIRNGAGSLRFNLGNGGDFTAVGDITAFSDERWKKNWRDLPATFVADLASVKMGIYDRIDTEGTQVGVSAQGLRRVMPNAVLESATGNLSVAYGNAALASCVALAREFLSMQDDLAVVKQELALLKG